MKTNMRTTVVVLGIFLLVTLCVSTVSGEDQDPKILALLRGVNAVHVQVKNFDPELSKELKTAGLIEDQVQIGVEKRLEQAGITVQSEQEFRKSNAKAVLIIKLELVFPEAVQKVRYIFNEQGEQVPKPDDTIKYVYRTDVVLRQNVSLGRDPAIQGMAVTWSAGTVGFRRLVRIRADLMDQVGKFIDAHKAANLT